ncbi:VOC family protein [Ectothiorhodospiraceae bacterium 2226]|nr:VOC family protein [Ectothiorhodospiraceae bacterium 2226]
MNLEAYLFLDGRCEEALAFYQQALGAELLAKMRFSESPEPPPPDQVPPGSDEKIMHAAVRVGDSVLMLSDGNCTGRPSFNGFALTLNADDEAAAERLFGALGEGGAVQMPLAKTFFARRFGMVADRFGVPWMVIAGARE